MRTHASLLCLLSACRIGMDEPMLVDAGIDGEPPPPPMADANLGCRQFGPFTKHGSVTGPGGPLIPTGIASDPHVIREGQSLRMWFTTSSPTPPHVLRIAYAESTDGQSWTHVRDNLIRPSPSTFDSEGIETVSVVRDANGYVAYYTADNPPAGSNQFSIGRATSADGLTWTKRATAVYPPRHAWEQPVCADTMCTAKYGGTLEPSVLFDGVLYHMWYAGLGAVGGFASYRIGYMASADGVVWSSRPTPVFSPGPLGSWDEALVSHPYVVAAPGGGYHLFYFGASIADHDRCDMAGGCLYVPGGIGHAFSPDGLTWTRNPANPIVRSESGFDAWSLGGPSVMIENGTVRLWYMGTPAAQTLDIRIGYATAPCM